MSAAGRYVVSGSAAGAIKLWNLTEGVQLDMQETAHPAGVSALTFLEPAVVRRWALDSRSDATDYGLSYCDYSSIIRCC